MGYIQTHKHTQWDPSVVLIGESVQGRQNCIYYRIFFVSLTSQFLCLKIGGLLQSRGIITIYLGSISQRINNHGKTQKRKIICNFKSPKLKYSCYLFSLALCLKSSIAFLKRVTLNRPLSLSSNSSLEERRWQINAKAGHPQCGRHILAGFNMHIWHLFGRNTDLDY